MPPRMIIFKYIYQGFKNYRINIKYLKMKNLGRAPSLYKGIFAASGKYTIIMDSDDYFYPKILKKSLELCRLLSAGQNKLAGVVFTCSSKQKIYNKLPTQKMFICNYLQLRATIIKKGDLKEIIQTSLLKNSKYLKYASMYRIPTRLLYDTSENNKILFVNENLIEKNY